MAGSTARERERDLVPKRLPSRPTSGGGACPGLGRVSDINTLCPAAVCLRTSSSSVRKVKNHNGSAEESLCDRLW